MDEEAAKETGQAEGEVSEGTARLGIHGAYLDAFSASNPQEPILKSGY